MGRREAGIPYNFDASEHLAVESFMPAQYAAMRERRESSPEKRFLLAILEGAVRDLQFSANMKPAQERLYREAQEWVATWGDDYVTSFETICGVLSLPIEATRMALLTGDFKRTRRSAAKSNGKVAI